MQEENVSDLKDPRVLFAAERTLLAWNRTSLSLIAFGFAVERTGRLIQVIAPEAAHSDQLATEFWLGIAFIILGTVTSVYSARQFMIALRTLTPAEFPPGYAAKWGILVNLVVAMLGLALGLALWLWHSH